MADLSKNPMRDPNFDMRTHDVENPDLQGALFSNDELIVPDSVRSLKKAVSAIHVVPTKAEHAQSLNNRRLFDACILVALVECRGREAEIVQRLKADRISPMFEVRISHLADLASIPGKNYQRLYEELDNLYDMTLNWNVLGEDSEIHWEMKAHFFSILGYGKNYKKGMVRFAFDASVLQLFLEPSIWAKLSLDSMGGLKTSASYALYQNCWRYAGTHNKVTAALPTHVWVELLVGKFRYVTEEPDGRKVVQYGDFKRRVLDDAIRRVNECAALSYALELKPIKSGNRVAKLQFKFVPKTMHQDALPLGWPADVIAVLEKLQLNRQDIDVLAQAHSLEVIAEALTRLQASEKRQREQGKVITSRRAYFEGILRNIAAGATGEQLVDEKIEAEIRAQEARRAADERMEKLREQFHLYQRNRFADWFAALSDIQREQLIADFLAAPEISVGDRLLLKKGVDTNNFSSQALLKKWLTNQRPEQFDEALPNPEDKTFENWMAWRLAGGDIMIFNG